jgi:glycosyltransferase involved in cell wall biosynthesis
MFSLHIDTGQTWRGGQRQTMYAVLGLRALGHRVALVAHPQGELLRRMSEGTDVIPLAPEKDVDLTAAWKLSRVIRQLRPEVVHARDSHAMATASLALSMASDVPRPIFVVSRRIDTRADHRSFGRWSESQADCHVAGCSVIRDRLVAEGVPAARTLVINEAVDLERVQHLPAANVHAELYLPTHAPIVGNVASLVPQKGHHHLIDAAAEVVRHVPDTRFVIVGDGELRTSLEDQVRHRHLERHVFLAGFRADALELIKGFDVFVASPVSEGMCSPLLDAMAARKPAVATAVGAIPELLSDGETGFLVPPRDHRAMAERLVALLEDGELRLRMGEAAVTRIERHFTVERMAERTAALYESLRAAGDYRSASRPPESV